jgi:nucleoid-associated protein YgaU
MTTTAVVAVVSHLIAPRRAAELVVRGWAGPAWWRAAVLTVCGLGGAVQASTAQAVGAERPPCAAACAPSLDGLPYPDLPTAPRADLPAPGPRSAALDRESGAHPGRGPPATVVVRHGDSLWSIAADLLPPRASAAAIAAHVDRLYAANRGVIGTDPDLIYPDTTLRVPGDPP